MIASTAYIMTDTASNDRPLDSWITRATYPSSNKAAREGVVLAEPGFEK